MPPNWFVRSTSQRGDGGDAVVVVPQETIDAFQEFFDAEDLTTVMNAFTSLCQMLDIVPGKNKVRIGDVRLGEIILVS